MPGRPFFLRYTKIVVPNRSVRKIEDLRTQVLGSSLQKTVAYYERISTIVPPKADIGDLEHKILKSLPFSGDNYKTA